MKEPSKSPVITQKLSREEVMRREQERREKNAILLNQMKSYFVKKLHLLDQQFAQISEVRRGNQKLGRKTRRRLQVLRESRSKNESCPSPDQSPVSGGQKMESMFKITSHALEGGVLDEN